MSAAVERALSAVRTIRASGADRTARSRRSGAAPRRAYDAGVRVARLEALVSPVGSIAVQGAFLAVLGVGGYRVASGSITVADLVAFILYLFLLVMPLGQAIGAWTQLQTGLGALARIQEILAPGPGGRRAPGAAAAARPRPAGRAAARARGRLVRLRRRHAGARRGCRLQVRRRQPGGAGRALGRGQVDDPRARSRASTRWTAGRSAWAGHRRPGAAAGEPCARGWATSSRRRRSWPARVRDNLLLTRPDATDPELWAVLADVGLTDVVRRVAPRAGRAGRRRGRAAVGGRAPAAGDRPVAARAPGPAAPGRADRQPGRAQRGAAARRPSPPPRPTGRCSSSRTGCRPCSTATRSSSSTAAGWSPRGTHAELVEASPLYRELATAQLLA